MGISGYKPAVLTSGFEFLAQGPPVIHDFSIELQWWKSQPVIMKAIIYYILLYIILLLHIILYYILYFIIHYNNLPFN